MGIGAQDLGEAPRGVIFHGAGGVELLHEVVHVLDVAGPLVVPPEGRVDQAPGLVEVHPPQDRRAVPIPLHQVSDCVLPVASPGGGWPGWGLVPGAGHVVDDPEAEDIRGRIVPRGFGLDVHAHAVEADALHRLEIRDACLATGRLPDPLWMIARVQDRAEMDRVAVVEEILVLLAGAGGPVDGHRASCRVSEDSIHPPRGVQQDLPPQEAGGLGAPRGDVRDGHGEGDLCPVLAGCDRAVDDPGTAGPAAPLRYATDRHPYLRRPSGTDDPQRDVEAEVGRDVRDADEVRRGAVAQGHVLPDAPRAGVPDPALLPDEDCLVIVAWIRDLHLDGDDLAGGRIEGHLEGCVAPDVVEQLVAVHEDPGLPIDRAEAQDDLVVRRPVRGDLDGAAVPGVAPVRLERGLGLHGWVRGGRLGADPGERGLPRERDLDDEVVVIDPVPLRVEGEVPGAREADLAGAIPLRIPAGQIDVRRGLRRGKEGDLRDVDDLRGGRSVGLRRLPRATGRARDEYEDSDDEDAAH